jgi:large subunit ribosomal protein L3
MSLGIICRKVGMSRHFSADGVSSPVSVLKIYDQRVSQVKDLVTDGYIAAQIVYGIKANRKVTKPLQGHYQKAGVDPGLGAMEFRLDSLDGVTVGSEISYDIVEEGEYVDVQGVSKGKGFAGTIKRWNFSMGDATHGNSLSHRSPGSIGQRQTPGRVWKGKKMSGRMGGDKLTVQNLKVIKVLKDERLILVKGAVPGAPGGLVVVKPAVKAKKKV